MRDEYFQLEFGSAQRAGMTDRRDFLRRWAVESWCWCRWAGAKPLARRAPARSDRSQGSQRLPQDR